MIPIRMCFKVFLFISCFIGTTSTPNDLWYNTIELPYHGESISMLIALPAQSSTPLSAIIPHISTKTIQSWMTTMVQKRVQVILPKYVIFTYFNGKKYDC